MTFTVVGIYAIAVTRETYMSVCSSFFRPLLCVVTPRSCIYADEVDIRYRTRAPAHKYETMKIYVNGIRCGTGFSHEWKRILCPFFPLLFVDEFFEFPLADADKVANGNIYFLFFCFAIFITRIFTWPTWVVVCAIQINVSAKQFSLWFGILFLIKFGIRCLGHSNYRYFKWKWRCGVGWTIK